MSSEENAIVELLKDLMRSRKRSISGLAADLGVSHSTVSRWVSGKYNPDTGSCARLAGYSGLPLERVLQVIGHISELADTGPLPLPEFREYAQKKYPNILSEDIITMIEGLIRSKSGGRHARRNNA